MHRERGGGPEGDVRRLNAMECAGHHFGDKYKGGPPGPDPLRRLPPPPHPPRWVWARKCRTMGAEGALRKFCLT